MKSLILLAGAAVALIATAPVARAQDVGPANATAPIRDSGNWTLKQREDWLNDHINKAHDARDIDGREADRAHHALDRLRDEENQLRGAHDGQLTDNETQMLEARLDDMAGQIRWLHENAFQRPW